jgi:DNA repair protein RecN (Recombination protein N)
MAECVLKSLTVRDFALVQSLDITFAEGLTVITGESGAGKSIMLGALALLLGERAAADTVRPGAARADVSAEFDLARHPQPCRLLEAQALTDPDQPTRCLIRRVVGADGRSRAFVNGVPVTLQLLRALGENLVDIHGQHENQRIGQKPVQLALLDDYGVDQTLRLACRDSYRAWRRSEQEAEAVRARLAQRDDRATLIGYQLEELEVLALQPGEFEHTESAHRRMAQAQALRAAVAQCLEGLEEDAALGRALRLLGNLDDDHERLASALELLRAADDLVTDAVRDLRAYDESLDLDPQSLEELETRLSAIHELARKHRVPPEQLDAHRQALGEELGAISTDRSNLDALLASAASHRQAFLEHARKLTRRRRSVAKELAAAASRCMNTLGIKGGKLEVGFFDAESEDGLEGVEFLVTTNPRYPAAPLTRIASGGERARISLAMQVVAAAKSAMPCLVLDEADVGVGGTTADVVGRLLRALAEHTQVICVTHAPQVAALGHHHLQVRKDEQQDTRIEQLARAGHHGQVPRRRSPGAGCSPALPTYHASRNPATIAAAPCFRPGLAACTMPRVGLPRVHKVAVQQGNVITQDMVNRLRPGMTRSQVAYVMGEPVFRNAFNDDRWDYLYTLDIPGYYQEQKRMSLYFENDVLAYFTGDYAPSSATASAAAPATPTPPDADAPAEGR